MTVYHSHTCILWILFLKPQRYTYSLQYIFKSMHLTIFPFTGWIHFSSCIDFYIIYNLVTHKFTTHQNELATVCQQTRYKNKTKLTGRMCVYDGNHSGSYTWSVPTTTDMKRRKQQDGQAINVFKVSIFFSEPSF